MDNFNTIPSKKLYGKLKTYKMEQEHKVILYCTGFVDNKNVTLLKTTTLVANETKLWKLR